jgi:hypothetical protein
LDIDSLDLVTLNRLWNFVKGGRRRRGPKVGTGDPAADAARINELERELALMDGRVDKAKKYGSRGKYMYSLRLFYNLFIIINFSRRKINYYQERQQNEISFLFYRSRYSNVFIEDMVGRMSTDSSSGSDTGGSVGDSDTDSE